MEQRLANAWRMTVNEKKFIETALLSGLRIDGRNVYDYRKLTLNFGREDGSAEVHLGDTRVMGIVTAQLVQPYRDRPNEGSLSIFTEFSPMADPSFEPGRPGESAVELGRVIDRGLRESRAVDTESLCVLAGKLVWAVRVDLHILDNGGNLVDAANIAALAALSTFRRPECSLGGEDGQEVIVHPPEAREPLSLIIHHLPIAVTFAFLSSENTVVIDPTHFEEAVMGGRMTTTLNTNGDICAIQKAGGEGVPQSVVMHCLRIAATKAADVTSKIKDAVEVYNTQRALRKIKRHPLPVSMDVSSSVANVKGNANACLDRKDVGDLSGQQVDRVARLKLTSKETEPVNQRGGTKGGDDCSGNFTGGPSSWDPLSKGVDSDLLKSSLASRGDLTLNKRQTDSRGMNELSKAQPAVLPDTVHSSSSAIEASKGEESQTLVEITLKDSVKPKHKRKKKASAATAGS